MKFSYWLELPMAIITLIDTHNSLEDIELARQLLNTSKAMEQLTRKLEKDIDIMAASGNYFNHKSKEIINSLKQRLNSIEKEKSSIMIQAIKFSIKLSNKFSNIIENCILKAEFPDQFILTKIKYFLSLIKNVQCQVMSHIEAHKSTESDLLSQNTEIQFCSVIKIFFEKIESKLFGMSLKFITNNIQEVNSTSEGIVKDKEFNHGVILKPSGENDLYKKRANSFCNKEKVQENEEIDVFKTPQLKLLRIDN